MAAENVVEEDAGYAEHRRRQRDAVIATQTAWGDWEAAKSEGQLAVALAIDRAVPTLG